MSTIYLWNPKPPEGSDEPTEAKLDFSKINNIQFDGIDHNDYPDFCDAYICSADYDDRELTQEELDEINENRDFVYEQLIKYLF